MPVTYKTGFVIIAVSCLSLHSSLSANTVGLWQAFEAAQKTNEDLAGQGEKIQQAKEQSLQVKGALFPSISATAMREQQKEGNLTSPKDQSLLKLSLSQPLFRGFKEFASIKSHGFNEKRQESNLALLKRNLLLDVTQQYIQILSLQKDIKNLNSSINLYIKRISELKNRITIGRSKETELLAVESAMTGIKMVLAATEGAYKKAKETFHYTTGLSQESRLTDDDIQPHLEPLSHYLSQIEERAEAKAALYQEKIAKEAITAARSDFLPDLNLIGNYYIKRTGAGENIPWDISLTLNIPIFDGGTTAAQVREAVSQKTEAELEQRKFKRFAESEITALYQTILSDKEQQNAIKASKAIATRTLDKTKEEYANGLSTNIEVLQALAGLNDAILAYDRMQYTMTYDYLHLLIVSMKDSDLPMRKP